MSLNAESPLVKLASGDFLCDAFPADGALEFRMLLPIGFHDGGPIVPTCAVVRLFVRALDDRAVGAHAVVERAVVVGRRISRNQMDDGAIVAVRFEAILERRFLLNRPPPCPAR